MKLIDEKKFLEGVRKSQFFDRFSIDYIERILFNHLKDLPKKKRKTKMPITNEMFLWDEEVGYNQCLKDCEDK